MATAISFASESGDHYLELFEGGETVADIVSILKEKYGDEFQYLHLHNSLSSECSESDLDRKICEAVEATRRNK
jgi:hypothetical protein